VKIRFSIAVLVFLLLGSTSASADCTNPPGVESQQLYNADYNTMQFCDGTNWWSMKGGGGLPSCAEGDTIVMSSSGWTCSSYSGPGGCTAPASCPNVGDVCSDGSLFAGFVVYSNSSCEPLYVTDNNQSTSSQWKTAIGTNDISTDDHVDGKVNAAGRGGSISDFPAFDLCESNTYHGKTDWYLPARAELNLLWLNRAAIDANAAGNFTTSYYWSSTENNNTNLAWVHGMGDDNQGNHGKTDNTDGVRCIRRD
jgi:hypothetical protein